MQASRIVLSTASSAAASQRPFLIPPRRSWDILKSAASASWTMLFSQEKRDQFVETLNKGIISPEVLSQADHGGAMVLALFHDLDSPLFTKHHFSAKEFTEGVKPALEQFHNVLGNLENTLYTEDEDETEENDDETSKSDKDSPEEAMNRLMDSFVMPPGEKDQLAGFLKVKKQTSKIQQMLKKNWKKEAEKDPESLAGQLSAMVTPQYFDIIHDFSKTRYMTSNAKVLYQDGSSEVNNVALLSARAMVVDNIDEKDGEPEKQIKDEELEVKEDEEDYFEQESRVAAQVEVLYDINQTFIKYDSEEKDSKVKAEDNKEVEEEKEEENDEENTITKQNVWVGVFEGWLSGNPDGTSDLRWKLILNRKAWEFPSLINTYQ